MDVEIRAKGTTTLTEEGERLRLTIGFPDGTAWVDWDDAEATAVRDGITRWLAARPARTDCRHCGKPLALYREMGLWFHAGRPRRGSVWCSSNPDLDNLDAETQAAPRYSPPAGPRASR